MVVWTDTRCYKNQSGWILKNVFWSLYTPIVNQLVKYKPYGTATPGRGHNTLQQALEGLLSLNVDREFDADQ